MIDENAFGILLSWFTIEDDEYGSERSEFVARFERFRATARAAVVDAPLGSGVRVVDLGHAVYVEIGDGDQTESPLGWAKKARARLGEEGFDVVAVVTHGGRWVDDAESFPSVENVGNAALVAVSLPSEPFRRALYADAASHSRDADEEDVEDEQDGQDGHEHGGWGPGLYLDVDAVEPLGIKIRNAPTTLRTGGAEFYRVGA
ncbi:MAG TPA: hypothetical protein VH062_30940 [Polyangiaceae bacterium]|jgi:hypothetical protein|nr:hypothetical protein [Polyangiaceae bacterium]